MAHNTRDAGNGANIPHSTTQKNEGGNIPETHQDREKMRMDRRRNQAMDEKMNNNEQQNISMDYRTESWATKNMKA